MFSFLFLEKFHVLCLAYDGNGFIVTVPNRGYERLYRVDLDSKTIIDSTVRLFLLIN